MGRVLRGSTGSRKAGFAEGSSVPREDRLLQEVCYRAGDEIALTHCLLLPVKSSVN